MRKRKALLKDFQLEYYEEKGATKTRVVYTGEYHCLEMDNLIVKRIRIEMFIYAIVINLLLAGSLLINTMSNFKLYIVIPQFLMIIISLINNFHIYPFLFGKKRFNSREKEEILVVPKGYFISKIALISITNIARIAMLIIEKSRYNITAELLLLVLCVISLCICVREFVLFLRIKIRKENKSNEDKVFDI